MYADVYGTRTHTSVTLNRSFKISPKHIAATLASFDHKNVYIARPVGEIIGIHIWQFKFTLNYAIFMPNFESIFK